MSRGANATAHLRLHLESSNIFGKRNPVSLVLGLYRSRSALSAKQMNSAPGYCLATSHAKADPAKEITPDNGHPSAIDCLENQSSRWGFANQMMLCGDFRSNAETRRKSSDPKTCEVCTSPELCNDPREFLVGAPERAPPFGYFVRCGMSSGVSYRAVGGLVTKL